MSLLFMTGAGGSPAGLSPVSRAVLRYAHVLAHLVLTALHLGQP